MKGIKQAVKQEVAKKVMAELNTRKEKVLVANQMKLKGDCPEDVQKAIETIKEKMTQCKLAELHPPFLPKTVTRYRHQYFLPIKRDYHAKIDSKDPETFKAAVHVLYSFVANFDCEAFDMYLEQIREPYTRKIFNDNYEFDKINFKEVSTQYEARAEVQNLLNSASEWLLQIQKAQDLLERIQLYFDIKTPMLIEKVKKAGIESKDHRTVGQAFASVLRNLTSYTLRKGSKVIQTSFFTAMAPAAVMLTLAIIGGSASLPFETDINGKLLIAPIVAITVPYILDGLASSIERKEFVQKLEEWTIALDDISDSISKFNEEIEETILACVSTTSPEEFSKQKINLEKYVNMLKKSLEGLTNFSEEKFQELRDRTEAYFKQYVEVEQGEWKVVIPSEDFDGVIVLKDKKDQSS